MRFMIIGGLFEKIKSEEQIQKFQNSCIEIGVKMRECGHSLVLCSPFNDSADYWVFQGYVKNESKTECIVDFYFVDCESVKKELECLEQSVQLVHINKILIPSPTHMQNESMKYAWLLCQLQALEYSQGIIAVGGKENGSADMLLQFGEQKRKNIFPFSFMGGAAMRSLYRKQYALMDRFGNKYSLLQDEIHFCEILNELEESIKSTIDSKEELRFFISYSRKHPYEADYIETILRRRGLEVFRDESDFGAGDEIPDQITEKLHASNVFIAVYCADYACSPWCYDELELALDLHEKERMKLWLFCVDETRVVSRRARNLTHYRVKTREEIEGKLLGLLI